MSDPATATLLGKELFKVAGAAVTVGDAVILASGVMAATGAVQSAGAAQRQAQFTARQARFEAERRGQIAEAEASDFEKRQRRLLAFQRAMMGASNVDPGSGTPLLVAGETAGQIELGRQRILAGGKAEATHLDNRARLDRLRGRSARTGGFLRAGALLLSSAATLDLPSTRTDDG